MATNTAIEKKPQTLEERLVEASIKEQEKQVKEQTAQRLQSGQSPEEILSALMQSIGQKPSSENLIGELSELAKTPVGTGKKMAIMPSLLSGQGFSRPEKTEPLGMGKAIQVMGLQQQIGKDVRGIPQEKIDLLNKIVTLAKETGNRELLGAISDLTGGTISKSAQLGPEAKERGRSIPDVPMSKDIGPVGEGTGITNEGFYETDPLTGKLTPAAEARQIENRERISAETKAMTKQDVNLADKEANFARVVTSFERAMAQLKGGIEEKAAGGLMNGLMGDFKIFTKRAGVSRAASYDAQMKETALSLNNILTGQNRVIKGVVQMILATFPDRKDPKDRIAQLFSQSVENAYGIFKAFEKSGYSPERLKQMTGAELDSLNIKDMVSRLELTPEELAERETFVNRILTTPAAPKRTLSQKAQVAVDSIDKELAEINRKLGIK